MNELLQEKLSFLEKADDFECWYLVKQPTDFASICYLVSLLKKYKESNQGFSLQQFISENIPSINEKTGLKISDNYRALLVASYFGLISKTAEKGSRYEDSEITAVYYEIEKRCNGHFENKDTYNDLIQSQLEKIYISTPIDDQYQGTRQNFKLYPIIFLYKVLYEIGKATGEYKITVPEYDFLVDTATTYEEFLNVLLLINLFRNDSKAQAIFSSKLAGKFDNRMRQALKQLDTLSFEGNTISLKQECINQIAQKICYYETHKAEMDSKDKLAFLRSTDTFISSNNNNLEKQETSDKSKNSLPTPHTHPKQIIFYGVPGCGKSHTISDMLKDTKEFTINSEEEQIVRTVFHPDYTNSDFVGQILPQVNDTKIEYNFVPGPFTKILAKALIHSENQYVLVIEEINRGNAAAIFGEIFQLLDRIKTGKTSKEKLSDGSINTYGEGWSEYFFMNDEINEYILKETNLEEGKNSADINGITFSVNTGIRLPPNLSILATMNTSDQNVFTLDNAFQRRWQMEYIPNKIDTTSAKFIGAVKYQYESTIGSTNVLWGSFRQVINDIIADPETSFSNAEDKQLGLFFINTTGDITNGKSIIDQKDFSNKVLKYLWNDIFKREKSEVFADEIKTFGDLLVNFDGADAFTKCFQSKITDLLEKE